MTLTTQKKDLCQTTNYQCSQKEDCKIYFKDDCVNGLCVGYDWCDVENNTKIIKNYEIGDNFLIWIRSFIHFDHFDSSKTL